MFLPILRALKTWLLLPKAPMSAFLAKTAFLWPMPSFQGSASFQCEKVLEIIHHSEH